MMEQYLQVVRMAVGVFPFIALAMSIPFMLLEYHRFGALSFVKGAVVYSFVLYMTCAYCLVILPLPDRAEVAKSTAPWCNLIPFRAVRDFFRESPFRLTQPSTYLAALKHKSFYTVAFNLALTLPFGAYVRYYRRAGWQKALLLSFLLSLFFELTQLSGLYFLYPRPYRLFDVDDLIANSLGGLLGWACSAPLIRWLPSREAIERDALRRGRRVSGLRRTVALLIDLGGYLLAVLLPTLWWPQAAGAFAALAFFGYYILLSHLLGGHTPVEAFLRLRVTDGAGRNRLWRLTLRRVLFVAVYLAAPGFVVVAGVLCGQDAPAVTLLAVVAAAVYYLAVGVKFLFTERPMLYERLSGTRMQSTVGPGDAREDLLAPR